MKQSKRSRASMTVEAALVLPVFLFVILFFLFFYRIMDVQYQISNAAIKTGKSMTQYGYLIRCLQGEDSSKVESKEEWQQLYEGLKINKVVAFCTDSLFIKELVKENIDVTKLETSGIVDGWEGVSFAGSSVYNEEDCVKILVSYQIQIPFMKNVVKPIPIVQCVTMRCFNGYQPIVIREEAEEEETKEDEGEYVYVAENGRVYHTTTGCSHLKLTINTVDMSQISSLRNSEGAKYYPCETCIQAAVEYTTVFIAKSGKRYHSVRTCPGLKRTIDKVLLSEVGSKTLCKRCSETKEKTE